MTANLNQFSKIVLCVAVAHVICAFAQEPITARWIGPANGGEWNTPAFWDTGAPPLDPTTNAFIGVGTNVNYNTQMTAERFGQLILHGVLNVNAPGFNCSSNLMIRAGGGNRMFINSGGVVDTSGNFIFTSNASVTIGAGGSLNVAGELMVGSGVTAPGYTSGGTAGASGWMTNNGGTIRAASTAINRANSSATSLLLINGGTNDLGAVTIRRAGPAGVSALGAEGLVISNGLVRMTSLDVGGPNGNSWLTMYLADGIVTNTGPFNVRQITAGRGSRFIQTGGLFVGTDANGVNLRGNPTGNTIVIYSVLGGTNLVEGFVLGASGDTLGTVNLTNAAKLYVGRGGFSQDPNATLSAINIALNSGGVFGAQADWTSTVPMILAGGAFDCANLDGTPYNITLSGALSGAGALRKFGAGTLTLEAANTYTADTIIHAGTLALGPSGSIATSPQIIVGPGATLDVSAVSGGFVHSASRVLGGFGTVVGKVTMASGSILNPGSNVIAGTLTITESLSQNGGAINHFDLSTNPFGPANDLVVIGGDLNVSDTNIIEVIGGGPGGSVHKLFRYGGSFNGSLNNFKVVGVEGVLSNNPALKEIYLVIGKAIRGPTNVTWIGSMLANNWDTLVSSNWLNAGVRDVFVPGDNARFDDTGAANPIVNVVGSVTPSWVTVDSTANYAYVGQGTISGLGGLTKLNTGTLTIRTTNLYTGPTLIMGGTVDVDYVAAGGNQSGLGAGGADPANLVISNATLRYSGTAASTDRGMTLAGNAVIEIANDIAFTSSGQLTGSGALVKAGAGTLDLQGNNSYTGGTVLNAGTVRVDGIQTIGPGQIRFEGGTLSLASTPSQRLYPNAINVVSTGTIIFNGANAFNVLSGTWSGSGTITISVVNSACYCTLNGDISTFSGTFRLTDDSAGYFRFNSGGSDPCRGSSFAMFDLGNSSAILANRNGSTYGTTNYYLGALAGGPNTRVRGALNTGTGNTYVIGEKNLDTTFEGIIENGSGGSGAVVSIVKAGTGTLTLKGANAYTGTTTVSNGVLALADSGSIDQSRAIQIVAPGILCVTGRYDGTLYVGNSMAQQLSGNGTVRGNLNLSWGGTLSPGIGIGTLTVTENATLSSSSTTWMEINRAAPQKSDKLVAKTITFGGTLVVTNVGTLLYPGDTFDLFDGAILELSTFDAVVLPNYYEWDTSRLTVDGTVRVVRSLMPPLSVRRDGISLVLSATNGIPGGPLSILSSTNIALPLSDWSVVITDSFDWEGKYSLTITIDPAEPRRFYLLLPY